MSKLNAQLIKHLIDFCFSIKRHIGDLGNIDFSNRNAHINVMDSLIKLNGPRSIIGRAFVIHERHDDMGKGTAFDSKTTGAAGPRLACCVVGIAEVA